MHCTAQLGMIHEACVCWLRCLCSIVNDALATCTRYRAVLQAAPLMVPEIRQRRLQDPSAARTAPCPLCRKAFRAVDLLRIKPNEEAEPSQPRGVEADGAYVDIPLQVGPGSCRCQQAGILIKSLKILLRAW